MLCLGLSCLLLHVFAVIGTELTFELPDNDKQCFYEELEKDTKFEIDFQVSYSNPLPLCVYKMLSEASYLFFEFCVFIASWTGMRSFILKRFGFSFDWGVDFVTPPPLSYFTCSLTKQLHLTKYVKNIFLCGFAHLTGVLQSHFVEAQHCTDHMLQQNEIHYSCHACPVVCVIASFRSFQGGTTMWTASSQILKIMSCITRIRNSMTVSLTLQP